MVANNTTFQAQKADIQAETIAWINNAYPGLNYNQATCKRDVGYIIDALGYDMMFGSNFLSVWNAMSYHRALVSTQLVVASQLQPTLGTVAFVGAALKEITTGGSRSAGTLRGIERLKTSFDAIYDLVANGLGSEPAIVLSTPTGFNTSTLTNTAYATATGSNLSGNTAGYGDGAAQIRQNYKFIVAEVLQYFANSGTYGSVYTAEGVSGPAKGYRDIAYILDSVIWDMTYGGNYQSLIAGSAYYSSYALQVSATEKPAFIDALGRLRTIITQIVQKTAVSASAGNSITQITAGTAGSPAAGGFAQDRVQDVIDWITNALPNTSVSPYTGWVSTTLQAAYSDVVAQITNVKSDAVVWCRKYYQNVNFSEALALRDAGLVVQGAAYDMLFGTNFNAIQIGRAYNRANTSATTLRAGPELAQTLGAINFMYYKVKQIAASGAIAQIQTTIDDITTTLDGGVEPPVATWTQPQLPAATYTGLAGTVLSGGGNGSATFTITRYTNGNGYYTYTITPTAAGASYTTNSKIKILGTSIGGATPSNDIVLNVTQVSGGGVQAATVSTPEAAVGMIESNRSFILAEAVAYINANGGAILSNPNYTVEKSRRDAGYVLDALHFDLLYGGNWASQKAGMAYYSALYGSEIFTGFSTIITDTISYISTVVQSVITGTALGSPLQTTVSQVLPVASGLTGAAKDATQAAALITIIKNFVDNGLTTGAPTITVTTIATTDTFTSNAHGMKNGDIVIPQATANGLSSTIIGSGTPYFVVGAATNTFKLATSYGGTALTSFTNGTGLSIKLQVLTMPDLGWVATDSITAYTTATAAIPTYQNDVVSFINTDYSALTYDSTYAKRDVFDVTLAGLIDMLLGTNYASIQAGRGYNRIQSYKVLGYEKEATVAALKYLEQQIEVTLANYDTQLAKVQTSVYQTINLLENAHGTKPEMNGTTTYNNKLGIIKGAELLRANIAFLADEVVAYYDATFISTVSSLAASGNLITTSSAHKLSVNDPVVFTGTSAGGITSGTTYYVLSTPSTTTFTITTVEGYVNTNTGAVGTVVTLSDVPSPTLTAKYQYDADQARSDITYFLNAIVYDLQFTGNYKSLRYCEVLLNAVNGSEKSDMWRVRNGTGVRNMTMTGLRGVLTNPNSYGTQRPTAGAFTSLDPGFGPNDSNSWIDTRSCYVQNCTMFGTACTGAKIDGALHAGGYRSMVANDYTTIISDGIGVWVTGSEALTELVSVFNYYGYAGYLSELGGKIRATNGNSSYGTYGVIAEGVDTYETPIYGTLDNRYFEAQISNVVTDAENEILRFEYGNAGSQYTNSVPTISAAGYNATAVHDEFRDATTFETRLVDLDDGNGVGGTNYVSVANVAQGGNVGYITIAATDTALSAGYVGMRIQITAGTGVGQYANILTYNNGSKDAIIYKDSFTNLTITGSTTTVLQTASTATLYVNMPILLSATTAGILTANTVYYVAALSSATTFTVKSSTGGSAITGLTATSGQTITLYAAGWDHAVPGTAEVNTLDLTSAYIIEPRISYTGPGYTATANAMHTTATWSGAKYAAGKYVAIATGSAITSQSSDGINWTTGGNNAASSTWNDITYGGGEGATATAVVGGIGGSGAVLTAVLGTGTSAGQVVSVTIDNGGYNYTTPPTIVFTATSGGSGAAATATVLNGAIVSITIDIPGSGYGAAPTCAAATDRVTSITANTWGKNYFTAPTITISTPGGITASAWTASTSVTSGNYLSVTVSGTTNYYLISVSGTTASGAGSYPIHTSGTVVNGSASLTYYGTLATATPVLTIQGGSIPVYGVASYTMTNNGVGYSSTPTVTILDTGARWVAIRSGASAASSYQTLAGLSTAATWTAGNTLQKTDLVSIAYGAGIYVAVGGTSGTASAVSSSDGATWIDRSSNITALGAGYYSAIAYGAGTFVAIQNSGLQTSWMTGNPGSWTAGGNLPLSTTWVSLAFGNNRFVALAATGRVAYSIDRGVTWTNAPAATGATTSILSSSYTWSKIAYGQGLFFAIAQGTTVCATSPDGINWTVRAMPSISNWKAIEFGNANRKPLWVGISTTSGTVTASIRTGAQPTGRMKVAAGIVNEVRMIEPGSGFPKGTVTATTASTNIITTSDTINLVDSQPVAFTGLDAYGLATDTIYYVIGSTIVSNTSFKVSATAGSSTPISLTTATGLSGTYRAGPTITQVDPNKVKTAALRIRMGDGGLGNPTFTNRGTANTTATATTFGDGYVDLFQPSSFVNIANLYSIPTAGANVQFASIPNTWFKLVATTNVLGIPGNYTCQFQINPALTTLQAPAHGDVITTALKYSQVRLTGHDYLYIGTGNFTETNYPNVDPTNAIQANQELFSGGGRVFFTSTDQDGNFNVGNLFGVQQATGTATLNASAFNLSGLQSLQLGAVTLGVGSAVITQFSTDPYFTANSDHVVPTQRAIKAYITSQIGGGSSALNVNTLTAGQVYIANNTISNTTGAEIKVTSKMNFTGGVDGAPVALGFFLTR